jgi:hypothetical protein
MTTRRHVTRQRIAAHLHAAGQFRQKRMRGCQQKSQNAALPSSMPGIIFFRIVFLRSIICLIQP